MNSILKYVKLQHKAAKYFEFFIVVMSLVIPFEFLIIDLFFSQGLNSRQVNLLNAAFYIIIIICMFFYCVGVNDMNFRVLSYFRASRKQYYSSYVIYSLSLIAILDLIHMFIVETMGMLFKNFDVKLISNINYIGGHDNLLGIIGQFVFFMLFIFSVMLIFNNFAILSGYHEASYILMLIVLGIAFYPLKVYSAIITFLNTENLAYINIGLLMVSITFIYTGWLLIKEVDIYLDRKRSNEVKITKREKKPMEKNFIIYTVQNLPKNLIILCILIFLSAMFKINKLSFESISSFILGILSVDTGIFVYCSFRGKFFKRGRV